MVFIEHNSLKSDIFLIPYLFHIFQDSCFSGSTFFRVWAQAPGSGFRSSQLIACTFKQSSEGSKRNSFETIFFNLLKITLYILNDKTIAVIAVEYCSSSHYCNAKKQINIKIHMNLNFDKSVLHYLRLCFKGALSGLLPTESPLKMMKNAFYFTSKALFVLKIFKFLS